MSSWAAAGSARPLPPRPSSSRAVRNYSPWCCCWSASWGYSPGTEAFGALGLAGFFLAVVGSALAAGALWSQVFVVPRLAEAAPEVADRGKGSVLAGFLLSFLLFGVGWAVFGEATLRAQVFPRCAAVLLVDGAVVSILPLPSRALVVEVAAACPGFILLAGKGVPDWGPARVS